MKIFSLGGDIKNATYLFLVDFVDREYHRLGPFLLLLCNKVRYPKRITLLRGNHESRK